MGFIKFVVKCAIAVAVARVLYFLFDDVVMA